MEINIRDNWDRLSAATRQWLTDNPGCLILPRTLVATISKETGGSTDSDQHGETTLSQEDRDFIQAKAGPGPATGPEHPAYERESGTGIHILPQGRAINSSGTGHERMAMTRVGSGIFRSYLA